jgi:integrase
MTPVTDPLAPARAGDLVVDRPSSGRSPGQLANDAATRASLTTYRERLAVQSRRRHRADLALFARFLAQLEISVDAETLATTPAAWSEITWGLVAAFVRWQLAEGYAVASINARLSTVRRYAGIAHAAGYLSGDEWTRLQLVRGYSPKEARRVNEQRETYRLGAKKAQPLSIDDDQVAALKTHPDTPQGRRDTLLMCLLLDHGLRVGEVAALQVAAIDVRAGTFTFYRSKVSKEQTHRMTLDTYRAAVAYLQLDASPAGQLLQGSHKSGVLSGGMSTRAIAKRVQQLGQAVGLDGLSPHDCRHAWATAAMRGHTNIKSLQDAGGWSSPAMPLRYAESAQIANEGVTLARQPIRRIEDPRGRDDG